jgi:hypothetical protein
MGVRKPKKLKVSASQLKALQGRIKNRALAEEDWDVVMAMTETVECLSKALAENKTSLARLCKYLLGAPTETVRNIFGKDTPADPEKSLINQTAHPVKVMAGSRRPPIPAAGRCISNTPNCTPEITALRFCPNRGPGAPQRHGI